MNAVADVGVIESKLIAGLGIEANTRAELGGHAAGELQPRRLFDQRYLLVVQNGGTLTDFGGFVGDLPGSRGTATVSGAGSTWTNASNVVVGGQGMGALTIQNGGTVNSGGGSVGLSVGSTGTVTVTGPGSSWNNSPGGGLNIGSFGTGTLTIANGGTVINNTAFTANIGNAAGSQGTVTVTGPGSTWSNSSGVNIGNSGTGTLTVANGGIVSGPVVIATNGGSIGTLNIGAGASKFLSRFHRRRDLGLLRPRS